MALKQGYLNAREVQPVYFTSGWEMHEAMLKGEIDLAIMPFTYAWSMVSQGCKVKVLSCLERETDGILVNRRIKQIQDLNNAKIGVLKASTLEVLVHDFALHNNLDIQKVYFHTPAEMSAALQAGQVDAIVSYVPTIQTMGSAYTVLHWFASDYPGHPCCDLVCTPSAMTARLAEVQKFWDALAKAVADINEHPQSVLPEVQSLFGLDANQAAAALSHTVIRMGISAQDREFERMMMLFFKEFGYQDRLPGNEDIYFK